jgi:hypothetical protein
MFMDTKRANAMSNFVFDAKELEGKGFFPVVGKSHGYEQPPKEKLNTPITPRKNWELIFAHNTPCWIPESSYNDTNIIMPDFIPDNDAQGPNGGYDNLGIKWIPCSNPELPAFVEPGFIRIRNIEEVVDFPMPDVDSWSWVEGSKPYLMLDSVNRMNTAVIVSGMFERMINAFGFENAAAYLLTDENYVHIFLDKLLEMNSKIIKNFHKHFKVDIILFHDDWGAQRAPFFSVDTVRKYFTPRFKALTDLCHGLGMKFIHHSCGRSASFVPAMVEAGVDMWNLQFDANEDLLPKTIEKYGERLLFELAPGYHDSSLPKNDDDFKTYIFKQYGFYGKTGKCTISIIDLPEANRSFDMLRFCYESARKTAQKIN